LKTVNPGDGGFGCSPGSHLPENFKRLKQMPQECWKEGWTDSPWTRKHPAWDLTVPIDLVTARAGDCVLFSEKLSHGTAPWTGNGERRTVYLKYVPYGMHHSDRGYDVHDETLTSKQRAMVEFPGEWFNLPTQKERQDYDGNPGLTRLHALAMDQREPAVADKLRRRFSGPGLSGIRHTATSRVAKL
jgi:hypothetical protein